MDSKNSLLNVEHLGDMKKSYSIISQLKEERNSISEDIREEKIKLSKKTGLAVNDINSIMKFVGDMDNEKYSEDDHTIAKALWDEIKGIHAYDKENE